MDLIVAVDQNWGIGKKGDLLFSIPEDMKFFRSMTLGKTVICGRKTLDSFPGGKPLPNRKHFVLSRGEMSREDVVMCADLDALFCAIADIPQDEIMVIGGESVYRLLLPYCRLAYVTKVERTDPEADVFFPDLDLDPSFSLIEKRETMTSKNGTSFSFHTYCNQKIKPIPT